jgi:hypothetical protein
MATNSARQVPLERKLYSKDVQNNWLKLPAFSAQNPSEKGIISHLMFTSAIKVTNSSGDI